MFSEAQKNAAAAAFAQRPPTGFMPPPFFPPGFPVPGRPMPPTNPDDAWNEYTAPDGRKYYFNAITQENTWDKPQVLIDREAGKVPDAQNAAIAHSQAAAIAATTVAAATTAVAPVGVMGGMGMPLDAIAEAQAKAQAALAEYLAQVGLDFDIVSLSVLLSAEENPKYDKAPLPKTHL
ncbi:WW domain protein [Cooperia oncophora]